MTPVSTLLNTLRCLTVAEACWLLRVYQYQHDEMYHQPNRDRLFAYWTTPDEFELTQTARAGSAVVVKIRFLGGPKGARRYYGGNLVSLVVDRILLASQTRKIGFTWLLSFSQATTRHIKDQLNGRIPDALQQRTFFDDERDGHYEPPTLSDRKHDDLSPDNPVVDYVQIGDETYSIHENGSQEYVVNRDGVQTPIRVF